MAEAVRGTFARPIFFGRRDEVIFRLLDTGVRVSELCGLKLTDVDLERELAYVTGKGSRPRVVPFGAKTGQAIDRYLRIRAPHDHASSPQLLLGLRGPMTVDRVPSGSGWAMGSPAGIMPAGVGGATGSSLEKALVRAHW